MSPKSPATCGTMRKKAGDIMITIHLTDEEYQVLVDLLDNEWYRLDYMQCDDDGNFYDDDYPDDAKRANVIQKILTTRN